MNKNNLSVKRLILGRHAPLILRKVCNKFISVMQKIKQNENTKGQMVRKEKSMSYN